MAVVAGDADDAAAAGTGEEAREGRHAEGKMVRWFDFAVGLLVVAGHRAPFGSAMADTWLGRQGQRDAMAQPSKGRQANARCRGALATTVARS
jgi:hypothetical protein